MAALDRVREALRGVEVDGLLITDIDNVRWLTGFTGSFGRVLVTQDKALFITDSRYTIQSGEQVKNMPSVSFANPTDVDVLTGEHAASFGIKTLGFEASNVTYSAFEKLRDKIGGIQLASTSDILATLRMVKSPEEVEKIRNSCKLTDATFMHLLGVIQPGRTEFDVHLDLEFYIRRNMAELAFHPIVVSGERSARPHGVASEKVLEDGDFLTMDFGAQIDGYNADLTRTVVVGKATDRHHQVYNAVHEAQAAAMAAMKPGALAKDVDKIARDTLAKYDLAQYFGHGLGHGLGRVVHDTGRLSPTSADVLEVGQVWTIEPGVYIPGFGGVRIEDDAVITETGIDVLTSSPKHLIEVPQLG